MKGGMFMTASLRLSLVLAASLWLSACGFHLRGQGPDARHLPFASVALETTGRAIAPILQRELSHRADVQLVSDPKAAEAVLTITDESNARDILTLNRTGKISEYQLVYRVTARVTRQGRAFGDPVTVFVRRDFPYSDSSVLGKEQEEQLVWSAMREEAVTLLMYRLSALKPSVVVPAQ